MDFTFQNYKDVVLVQISQENVRVWPVNGDSYGALTDCPYQQEALESLKISRRKLEDLLRKNQAVLIDCLELVGKQGFPV